MLKFEASAQSVASKQASKRTPLKRHEETQKWNEMKDEYKYEMELI